MSTPWFFLSYARASGTDEHVLQFYYKLIEQMRAIRGELRNAREDEIGFMDKAGIENGALWADVLEGRLRECRVLVCLYSDGYFTSEFCGKEFWAFRSRSPAGGGAGTAALNQIVPVLWLQRDTLPERLPRAVRGLQYANNRLGQKYEESGLFLIKTTGDDKEYIRIVYELAKQIVDKGRQNRLPALECLPPFNEIPNAWDERDAPPAAPTNLRAEARSHSSIEIEWRSNSDDEEGFKVVRCVGVGCQNFDPVCPVPAKRTSYVNVGLMPNTTYCYRVRAYNAGGESDYSNIACDKTLPPPSPRPLPRTSILIAVLSVALLATLAFILWPNSDTGTNTNTNTNAVTTSFPEPNFYKGSWDDQFKRKNNGAGNDAEWVQSGDWEVPGNEWRLQPESLSGALLVKSANPGIVKDKVWGHFDLDFKIKFERATRAGWVIHAQGDRQQGYGGYFFVLERPKQGPLELRASFREPGKEPVEFAAGRSAGITQYGKNRTDGIWIRARVEGNKFIYRFELMSAVDDGRADLGKCFSLTLEYTDLPTATGDPNRFVSGLIGLFAQDDGKPFLVEYFSATPVAPNNPLKDPDCNID